jgi:glycosyltransferase involved in cell wall biosynthesis
MARERVDLVHANEHWVGPVSLFAARLAGVPAICHFRTGLGDLTRLRVWKYSYARFDRVIAVAQVLADTMRRYVGHPERIVVIRDGVEPPKEPPRYRGKSSRTIVMNVGALYEVKGQAKILELAMPWLQEDRRRYLVFVGGTRTSPSYVDDMKRLVAERGLERQVLFLGNREDVPRLLRLADALVAYSTVEGVPRVVMEAMFAGRPVIVSNTPGMEEVVLHGQNGLIVDFDDPSNPLAQALRNLSDAPDHWQRLGRRASEMAREKYSTEAMSNAIQSIYRELLEHGAYARSPT